MTFHTAAACSNLSLTTAQHRIRNVCSEEQVSVLISPTTELSEKICKPHNGGNEVCISRRAPRSLMQSCTKQDSHNL
jgi:hypothetical protein